MRKGAVMLIQCPECTLQISDKALFCPHCGYPLKEIPQKLPSGKKSSRKYKRLPNGFGQITELKKPGLKNKFRAMVSEGKTEYGRPIQKLLRPRAYFPTYKDAYEALIEYHKNPYDLSKDLTVKEVYEKWLESFKGNSAPHTAAWQYCSSIYDMKIRDVRVRHIKGCIENGVKYKDGKEIPMALSVKPRIKQLFVLILDYAMEYELVDKNYARAFKLSNDIFEEIEENKEHHIAFTDEELVTLWNNQSLSLVDIILFQCYSGWRPQELCEIKISNVHLDEHYTIGGMKTRAGKKRPVPIHPKVQPIVQKYYDLAISCSSEYLFNVPNKWHKEILIPLKYDRFYKDYKNIIEQLKLNPEHKPHDPRKTFVTMAKKAGMDEWIIKRIVGHAIADVTEESYTQRSIEELYREVCKIP